jgi:hypothetical protein
MNVDSFFVADAQPTELIQPGESVLLPTAIGPVRSHVRCYA